MSKQIFLKILAYVLITFFIFYLGLYAGNHFTTKYYDKRPDKSPTFYESITRIKSAWPGHVYKNEKLCDKENSYSFIVAGHTYGFPGGGF